MKTKNTLIRYRFILILLLVLILLYFFEPRFFSLMNLSNIMWSVAVIGIMSAGAIYPIITAGIDLSVGSMAGFTSTILVYLIVLKEINMFIAIGIVLLLGIIVGFLNGYLISKFKIPAFVMTMAMLNVIFGTAMVISQGRTIGIMQPKLFTAIGSCKILGVPFPVYLMLGIMLMSYIALNQMTFGRKILSVGGNPIAAKLSGVDLIRIVTSGYMLSSICAVISGIVLTSMTQQGRATMGKGFELDVITAIVIGGASLSGGKGTIGGTLFGVILVGIMGNLLILMDITTEYHTIIKGFVVILVVSFNQLQKKKGRKS